MDKKLKRKIIDGVLCLSDDGTDVLRMKEVKTENGFEIQLDGQLISDTVHDFQDELTALMIMGFDLKIDMKNVSYISSACEAALLSIQLKIDERQKGKLTLVNVPESIMNEFISTGLADLLRIN